MIIVPIIQFIVCFLILKWLIKKKTGEPFSRKTIVKFLLFGAISVVAVFAVMLPIPIEADTFFHFNPLINGFLTALLTGCSYCCCDHRHRFYTARRSDISLRWCEKHSSCASPGTSPVSGSHGVLLR